MDAKPYACVETKIVAIPVPASTMRARTHQRLVWTPTVPKAPIARLVGSVDAAYRSLVAHSTA
jgi:hypothetical protein